MKLTATPFDPQTGELLPVYRDAYLQGDLARSSARAVEDYLRKDPTQAHTVVTRWHEMTTTEQEAVAPTTWVKKQLLFIRQEPQRFRRRALTMVGAAALIAGVSIAGTRLPSTSRPANLLIATPELARIEAIGDAAAEANASRMVTVRGRILNEMGEPLAGATVLRKGAHSGVSTNANGEYMMEMTAAAAEATTLKYGYAGYDDRELKASEASAGSVVLRPQPTTKRKHWWSF